MTTTEEIIESLVEANYGGANLRTQHYFRQSLQVLVELAKCEERQEISLESAHIGRQSGRVVH